MTQEPIHVLLVDDHGDDYVIARDLGERVEEALREKDEQLRRAQKLEAIGRLASGIAHEFSNLLQAVLGYTRYAMRGLPPEGGDVRALLFTGYDPEVARSRFAVDGGLPLLHKPIDPEVLLRTVREVLDRVETCPQS